MSKSEILPFQDANGDGLNDVCDEVLEVLPPKCGPDCTPNSKALVPNWQDAPEPFLNEKRCYYQTTITTRYDTTFGNNILDPGALTEAAAAAAIEEIYSEYVYDAIEDLLNYYDKANTSGTQAQVFSMIERTNWDLNIRKFSRLKLLYSVPTNEFDALPPAEEDESEPSDTEISFATEELSMLLVQLRKGLWMYGRNLKIYRKVENSNLLFVSDNSVFNLDQYGDFGLGAGSSIMSNLISELDEFLNNRGFNLQGEGGFISEVRNNNRAVSRLSFGFTSGELTSLTIEAAGCREGSITYTGKLVYLKTRGSAWVDKTALNYLINIREMTTDLTARSPTPWIDFLIEYTYPEIYTTANSQYDHSTKGTSCVGNALVEEAKQLGEDILDEVFSLGDAIAYQFHKQTCAKTTEELQLIKEEMSLYLTAAQLETDDEGLNNSYYNRGTATSRGQPLYYTIGTTDKIKALATEQAYAEIAADDEMFSDFCLWLFGQRPSDNKFQIGIDAFANLKLPEKLHRLKICGLLDLMVEAIQCLMSGLSLQEALGKLIQAALQGMSVKSLDDLFVGLPLEKQEELGALLTQKLESGEIFRGESNTAAFDAEAGNYFEDDEQAAESAAAAEEARLRKEAEHAAEAADPWGYERAQAAAAAEAAAEHEALMADPWGAAGTTFAGEISTMVDDSLGSETSVEEADWKRFREGNTGGASYGEWTESLRTTEGSLAQGPLSKLSEGVGDLNASSIVGAYIQALHEVYIGDELALIDLLGNFPGAPLVTKIIASMQCPVPPFFSPPVSDMFKDWELPICTNMKKITWPQLQIPPRHKFKDLWIFLKNAIKLALAKLLQQILVMLIVKVCEILSKAACAGIGLIGDLAKNAVTGENTLAEMVRESICGDSTDEEQLANTVQDLFSSFGNGAGALSDSDEVMDFAMDLSSAVTQNEMASAFLGEPSSEFLIVADNLCTNEYPTFTKAFGDKNAIKKAFENMGNIMPVSFRDSLRDSLTDEGDTLPSNPTLCATDAALEEFCENRATLLEGRASPGQIRKHCDDFRNALSDDLGDLAPIMNDLTGYIEDNMPPLVSDPGCNNGIMPYEPEEVAEAVGASLGNSLEKLKIAYSTDMLGNGPGKKNWGMMNMILSDTMGQPLSTHHRKTSNQERRVDFYRNWSWSEMQDQLQEILDSVGVDIILNPLGGFLQLVPLVNSLPRPIEAQRGAYPLYVGEWLREQIGSLSVSYDFNNTLEASSRPEIFSASYSQLIPDFSPWKNRKVNYLGLPDFGYNVKVFPNSEEGYVEFVKPARKNTPDVTLPFRDNARGIEEFTYAFGFDIEAYFADLSLTVSGSSTPKIQSRSLVCNRANVYKEPDTGIVTTTPSDSTRVKIYNILNQSANFNDSAHAIALEDPIAASKIVADRNTSTGETIKERLYEFMCVENTFDGIDLDPYPKFQQCFNVYGEQTPQQVLLHEMVDNASVSIEACDSAINTIMSTFQSKIQTDIYDNENAWLYGAAYDSLTGTDAEYVIPDNTPNVAEEYWGGAYQDAMWTDPDPEVVLPNRQIKNDDMILGLSRMQYQIEKGERGDDTENRVFYLDPILYGGTYMNPPVYIKPLPNKGWTGLVDALFPEMNACKPSLTDLVDFEDIESKISELYRNMPEDDRLARDPECVVEKPYNRILDRSSKSFLRGLVPAAIRIYASTHIIKSLSVFTKFIPRVPEVCSAIYASYIIEQMENSFKDAQGDGWELFTLFKDEEFWYAFLEQAVETYATKIEDEEIIPPPHIQNALTRLNYMQVNYEYPNKQDLKDAKDNEEVSAFKLLKHYRSEQNLEAVQATEEDAKLILLELVVEELNIMSKKIIQNLDAIGLIPDVKDISYYILDNFTAESDLTLNEAVEIDGSFQTIFPDLPTVPYDENDDAEDPYYTDGGEFVMAETDMLGNKQGEEYVGYYHVHTDQETGDIIYMEGEYHSSSPHAVLKPVINVAQIPIGNVPDLGTVSGVDSEKPFLVEKYIRINSGRYDTATAVEMILENPDDTLLSEIYPGTIEIVKDSTGKPVGITGEMGVRYGLKFSILVGSSYREITSVEMDALDYTVQKFTTVSANSALLACLINQLKNDEKFRLSIGYIFPIKKIVSLMAIYADMGLLASIGEKTVGDGEAWKGVGVNFAFDPETKPGMYAKITLKEDDDGNEMVDSVSIEGKPGWASSDDRNMWSPLFTQWDEWDQVLLKNSKARIKKLFKSNYNSRFREFDIKGLSGPDFGQMYMQRLRENLRLPQGDRILPRFRRKRIRSNPFNANGEACENEE